MRRPVRELNKVADGQFMKRGRTLVAKKRNFKFKRPKSQIFIILDDAKKEFGRVRMEPGEIGWRPAGSVEWHRIAIEAFAAFAVERGRTGEAPL